MLWLVVEFLKDESVAAVPEYWIKKYKNSSVQCYWPTSNVETLRKKLVQCAVNKKSRNFYACKILLKGETFQSFKDALAAEKKESEPSTMSVSQRIATKVELKNGTNTQTKKQENDAGIDMITEQFDAGQKSEEAIPESSQQPNTSDVCVTTDLSETKETQVKSQSSSTKHPYKFWKKTIMDAYRFDTIKTDSTTIDSTSQVNDKTNPAFIIPVTSKSVVVVSETSKPEVSSAGEEIIPEPPSITEYFIIANQPMLTSNTGPAVFKPTIVDCIVPDLLNFNADPINFDTTAVTERMFFDTDVADPRIAGPAVHDLENFGTVVTGSTTVDPVDAVFLDLKNFDAVVGVSTIVDPEVADPINFDTMAVTDRMFFDTDDAGRMNIEDYIGLPIGMDIDFEFIDLLHNSQTGGNVGSTVFLPNESYSDLHDQFQSTTDVGDNKIDAHTHEVRHVEVESQATRAKTGQPKLQSDNSECVIRLLGANNYQQATRAKTDPPKLPGDISKCVIRHLGANNYQDSKCYLYTKNNSRNFNLYLRCKNNIKHQCPARVTIHNYDYKESLLTVGHNHPPDRKILEKQVFVKQLEININRDPFQTPRQLYLQTKTELKEKIDLTNIPSLKRMEGLIYRRQRKFIPLLPSTVDEFERYILDEKYRQFFTNDHRNLPYFRGIWTSSKGERNLVFISESILRLANTMNHVSFFMDGTYRALPHHIPFRQLYVISLTYENQCYPLAYIFMEKKTFSSYDTIFKNLKFMLPSVEVVKLMTDYEAATRKALKKHFPKARLAGCYFHYVQAMVKSTKRFGLRSDDRFQDAVKKICHLALLPNDFVLRGFQSIDQAVTQSIQSTRWDRFQKYWIKQWGSANISVYGLVDRSNNFSESNNKSLNSLLMKAHPNIWYTIKTLKLLEMDKTDQLKRAIAGEITEIKQTNAVKLFNEKVVKATKLFDDEQDIDRFLQRVSYGENVELFVKHQVNLTDESCDEDIDNDYDEEVIPNDFVRESDFRRNHPR